MPRNKTGGNKAKKGKNTQAPNIKSLPRASGPYQHYFKVTKPCGNKTFNLQLMQYDDQDLTEFKNSKTIFSKIFLGKLRRRIRRGSWVSTGDIILGSIREFNQDDIIDIIYKYTYVLFDNYLIYRIGPYWPQWAGLVLLWGDPGWWVG